MSTRRERRREQRKRTQERARTPGRSVPWFTVLVVGVVAVGLFVGARSLGVFDTVASGPTIDPSQFHVTSQGRQIPAMDATHIPTNQSFTAYNSIPPTSGPHWSAAGVAPIGWGEYQTQQRDEAVTHNLEHGGVLITYNGISADDLAKLRSLRTRYPKDRFNEVKIVLEPYSRIDQGTIALAAWGWLDDKIPGYDEARIVAFLVAHIDKGPEDIP